GRSSGSGRLGISIGFFPSFARSHKGGYGFGTLHGLDADETVPANVWIATQLVTQESVQKISQR
ncbi:hypothetical protein, partial [Pseudomonas putida]